MSIISSDIEERFECYRQGQDLAPLFILGDALTVLQQLPRESFDFCMTSPPYWGKREYQDGGIGLEPKPEEYIANIIAVFAQVRRVLKATGSFWLNMGDSYWQKRLLGIPWRTALRLMDEQGWVLRNNVIWNKVKGGLDNSQDKLSNTHELVFHFVKDASRYYYNLDAVRSNPRKSRVVDGAVVSATGVRGIRYKRQIEMSAALSDTERQAALAALEQMLEKVKLGEISDFRMIIRGQQRTTHSNSEHVSGRARELREKGFYFLKYHPNGSKPGDVWDIIPEDTQKRQPHFAPYPEDLCKIPILTTCPPDGIALDPFCGTGTTMFVCRILERKSVGIDISLEYLKIADKRCAILL